MYLTLGFPWSAENEENSCHNRRDKQGKQEESPEADRSVSGKDGHDQTQHDVGGDKLRGQKAQQKVHRTSFTSRLLGVENHG
jgi:hypothetical protein